MGAQQSDIRRLIFTEGFRLVAVGVLGGIVLAVLLSRVLRSFLFSVQPSDLTIFVLDGALKAVGDPEPGRLSRA